ncbi:MAG TPA: hypothetical protein VMS17_25525, partial [Gemmataceae bacterium]|nr:hypothetical protein [Gemmataceae bacterium]
MKASTLFTLALALLVGLGLVVGVKYSGILNPPEKKADPPPPAPPPTPLVVAASRNLYAGDSISPTDVRLRPLTVEDAPAYEKNKAEFLPPVAESAFYRTVHKNITAGQAITLDLLEPMGKPEPLHDRLLPLTRAVDLQVTVENSAAGLIQVE